MVIFIFIITMVIIVTIVTIIIIIIVINIVVIFIFIIVIAIVYKVLVTAGGREAVMLGGRGTKRERKLPQRYQVRTFYRAGHLRNFFIFSIIKNDLFAFFIKSITYFCTSPI